VLGRLDVVRAAWALSGLRHDIDGAEADADFLLMAGVSSMTDHLPLDPVRHHWAPEALAQKDAELAEAAAYWGDEVRASCERIVGRLGPVVFGTG